MCAVGSSSTPGVGTTSRQAIGGGTVLGGTPAFAGGAAVRNTILGGPQRTTSSGKGGSGGRKIGDPREFTSIQ